MKNESVAVAFVAILCLAVIAWFVFRPGVGTKSNSPAISASQFPNSTTTRAGITFGHGDEYGLAIRPEQVLVNAYIPPCDSGTPGFDYCLYRVADTYADTNFESAGIRVKERTDLSTKSACLQTAPEGYINVKPRFGVGEGYATSVFSPLGDAAAGHYSTGGLYRLHFAATCYEFQTRIGESQFANYPKGSLKEFTGADRTAVQAELAKMLESITIDSSTERVVFPAI